MKLYLFVELSLIHNICPLSSTMRLAKICLSFLGQSDRVLVSYTIERVKFPGMFRSASRLLSRIQYSTVQCL